MAPPITWKNVNLQQTPLPNFGGELFAAQRGGEDLSKALRNLGGNVQDYATDKRQQETDAFIAELNAAPDDATRNQMVADAERAFLDIGTVNKAVTSAGVEDRSIKEFEDQLATNKLSREATQSNIDIAKANQAIKTEQSNYDIGRRGFNEELEQFAYKKDIAGERRAKKKADTAEDEAQVRMEQIKAQMSRAKSQQELEKEKFAEEKRQSAVTEKRNEVSDAKTARKLDLEFEEKVRTRDREKLLQEQGNAGRELALKLTELTTQNSIKNTKKSNADNLKLIPATDKLLRQFNDPDTTVTKNNAAIREFRKATPGLLGSPALEQLIKESNARGDALEIDQFGQTFNTPDPESGNIPTEGFLLKTVNDLNNTNFTNLSQLKSKHFSKQAQTNVIRAMATELSRHLGGRKTAKELLPDARAILMDNDEIKKSFIAQSVSVADALEKQGVKKKAFLEHLEYTEKKLNRIHESPVTEIYNDNVDKLKKQFGDSFDSDDQTDYKQAVAKITRKLQIALGFNSNTLTNSDKRLINGTIAKYIETISFDAGGLQIFNNTGGDWANNFRNLAEEDAEKLSNAALLDDLQRYFPNTTPPGKLIEAAGIVKKGKTTKANEAKDNKITSQTLLKEFEKNLKLDPDVKAATTELDRIAKRKEEDTSATLRYYKESLFPPEHELFRRRKKLLNSLSDDPKIKAKQLRRLEENEKIKKFLSTPFNAISQLFK